MATRITTKSGKTVALLNPSEKSRKYASDLHKKCDRDGVVLSDTQLSYRSGYLKAREDSGRAYASNNGTKYKKGLKRGSVVKSLLGTSRKKKY